MNLVPLRMVQDSEAVCEILRAIRRLYGRTRTDSVDSYLTAELTDTDYDEEIFEDNNTIPSDDTVEVDPSQLLIVTASLPLATLGVEYQADLAARGGSGTLVWSISNGMLPAERDS